MISKYDVLKAFDNIEQEGKVSHYRLDKETEKIYTRDDNMFLCSLDVYVDFLRKEKHCNFEVIYDDHVLLTTIYRCKDCGTVIFGGDDERWDPNLKCPVCGEYKTWLEYWSGEDIKNDSQKQKEIKEIIKMQEYMWEASLRHQKRGLYDFQLYEKKIKGKKYGCKIEFRIDNITNKWKLKGLFLSLDFMKRTEDDMFTYFKYITIPLSWKAFYLNVVYPHSKKCDSKYRKYYFWQTKPAIF